MDDVSVVDFDSLEEEAVVVVVFEDAVSPVRRYAEVHVLAHHRDERSLFEVCRPKRHSFRLW